LPRAPKAEEAILRLLRELGEAYQRDLVRASGFSKGRVSEVLARLHRRGLIGREAVGRSIKVYLRVPPPRGDHGRSLRLGLIRAAEYPYIIPMAKLLKERGIRLEPRVYDNGIDVLRDLGALRLDLAIAPLLTFFIFFSLGAPIRALAPAGSGGASIIVKPGAGRRELRASCTRLSTMEMALATAVSHGVLPKLGMVQYSASPEGMMELLERGHVDALSIWEPYASALVARGYRREARYSELVDHVCCVLGATTSLSRSLLRSVVSAYSRGLLQFRENPGLYYAPYCALMGLDSKSAEASLREYTYPESLDRDLVLRQLEEAGIRVPSPLLIEGLFKD